MADLTKYKAYKNNKFEVLTDDGFKDFKGVIVGENNKKVILRFTNGELICTPKHKIMINDQDYQFAKDLKIGDKIYNDIEIKNIEYIENNDPVYELLEVKDTHKYFVNGILSHQCLILDEAAHIQKHIMEDFWKSVFPIVSASKRSKAFMVSTPNGVDNLFYEIYKSAEEGRSGWHGERIDWWEVPGRDEEWKENMIRDLGSKTAFDQEFGNVFLEKGQSLIDFDLLKSLKEKSPEPEYVLEEGCYKIWEEPQPNNIYALGVDVAEGIGKAASVIQILNITDLTDIKQDAIYHSREIDPYHFTSKINEIAKQWGSPPILIERNNQGLSVIDTLHNTFQYENIAWYVPPSGKLTQKITSIRLGIFSHTNSKTKGVYNMRYWLNQLQVVNIRDVETIKELETFIKHPNGVWKKGPGNDVWDDRVDALMWALLILENDIAKNYFEIVQEDANGKPLKILPLQEFIPENFQFRSTLQTKRELKESEKQQFNTLPAFISTDTDITDIEELHEQGWMFPGDYNDKNFSSSSYTPGNLLSRNRKNH